jgi:hypothetical protein
MNHLDLGIISLYFHEEYNGYWLLVTTRLSSSRAGSWPEARSKEQAAKKLTKANCMFVKPL